MGHEMDWLRKALGLPEFVTYIGLDCRVGGAVTVECEYFPEIGPDGQLAIETEFARYRLERIEDDEPAKASGG
ncbi:MAG: hypothetical protein WC565_09940 [Parcubacteria group bacterium]